MMVPIVTRGIESSGPLIPLKTQKHPFSMRGTRGTLVLSP